MQSETKTMSPRWNGLLMIATQLAMTAFRLTLPAGLFGLFVMVLNALVFFQSSGALFDLFFGGPEKLKTVEISLKICWGTMMCNFLITCIAHNIAAIEGFIIWRWIAALVTAVGGPFLFANREQILHYIQSSSAKGNLPI